MKRLLLIVLPLLLIVGCSQKPVDETTLIDKDGVMYLPNSDKPYTGEVFKNYSTGEKVYQGTYENGLLIQYSYLNKDGSVKEPINHEETLNERDGVFYTKDTNKPYSGPVFSLFDVPYDGKKKEEGNIKDGEWYGLWTGWYENGQKSYEENYKDGKVIKTTIWDYYLNKQKKRKRTFKGVDEWMNPMRDGIWSEWYENGKKKWEETYKDGEKDGFWTEWYWNGQKSYEQTYTDGKLFVSNTWDKKGNIMVKDGNGLHTGWYDSGGKRFEETYKDGRQDSLWTVWYENGQKEREFTYKDGEKDGKWTEWYERRFGDDDQISVSELFGEIEIDQQMKKEQTYKDGNRDGIWTEWYNNGQKKSEIHYKDGNWISEKGLRMNGRSNSSLDLGN
jgi:antitoxin component YwqK of YwqJK toxin-antitoxin module